MRVLPSTAGSATWVIDPFACTKKAANCSDARGGLFSQGASNSWKQVANASLALEENLNYHDGGMYGQDTLSLGLTNATGGPTVESSIIATVVARYWYLGLFGLQQQPMNISTFNRPYTSFLSALRARNSIPSLSWAYTAGAHYRTCADPQDGLANKGQSPRAASAVLPLVAPTSQDTPQTTSPST